MADLITLILSDSEQATLAVNPLSKGSADPVSYLKVTAPNKLVLRPKEKLAVLVDAQSNGTTLFDASGMLKDPGPSTNQSLGQFIYRYTNDTSETKSGQIDICEFPIQNRLYENVKYNLYYLQDYEGSIKFDYDLTGVYSYPHNLQPNEVIVTAELISDGNAMRYLVRFPEVNNSGSVDYGIGHLPYELSLSYKNGTGTVSGDFDGTPIEFADAEDYTQFSVGYPTSGIIFTVPFYDSRAGSTPLSSGPTQYNLRLKYVCAGISSTLLDSLIIPLNHQQLANQELINLDTYVATTADPNKLRKVDEIYVERGIIDRKRLSIGIKDISVSENTYVKTGTYISKPYISDFPIYTFSMKVDEFIPEYSGFSPYDQVQYFIELNSRPWERISPITRGLEADAKGVTVPKMFVFDSDPGNAGDGIKYLNYQTPVTIFRVKIIFDLSKITDARIIPPEIRDYDCIIFDKNQLMET